MFTFYWIFLCENPVLGADNHCKSNVASLTLLLQLMFFTDVTQRFTIKHNKTQAVFTGAVLPDAPCRCKVYSSDDSLG